MIVKLVKPGGVAQLVECDNVMYQPTIQGTVDVDITLDGERRKRVIVGDRDNENAEYEVAYVMENGKTCDTIRQQFRSPTSKVKNKPSLGLGATF